MGSKIIDAGRRPGFNDKSIVHPEGVTDDVAFWHPAGVHPIVAIRFPGLRPASKFYDPSGILTRWFFGSGSYAGHEG